MYEDADDFSRVRPIRTWRTEARVLLALGAALLIVGSLAAAFIYMYQERNAYGRLANGWRARAEAAERQLADAQSSERALRREQDRLRSELDGLGDSLGSIQGTLSERIASLREELEDTRGHLEDAQAELSSCRGELDGSVPMALVKVTNRSRSTVSVSFRAENGWSWSPYYELRPNWYQQYSTRAKGGIVVRFDESYAPGYQEARVTLPAFATFDPCCDQADWAWARQCEINEDRQGLLKVSCR